MLKESKYLRQIKKIATRTRNLTAQVLIFLCDCGERRKFILMRREISEFYYDSLIIYSKKCCCIIPTHVRKIIKNLFDCQAIIIYLCVRYR